MKTNKETFYVWQGNLTESGGGDIEIVGEYNNLADAKKYFEAIKEDIAGYNLHPHGRIETWITKKEKIDDDAIAFTAYYY